MGLLLSFISQLSLRMQMGSSKSTYPISAQTLRRRPRNEGRVFGSACATLKLGTSSRLIWNPKSRSLDSKSTACGSDRTIPTTSSSRLSLSSNEAPSKAKSSAQIRARRFPTATSCSPAKRTRRTTLIREPMRTANICLEAFRVEITPCLSTHGLQEGAKFPARIR